jgi:SagB-type dehydrogenase family enzyme
MLGAVLTCAPRQEAAVTTLQAATIRLPEPRAASPTSIEEALRRRRSLREFGRAGLTLAEVAQLLWAAQGRTSADGRRTAPSAGALYPLEVLLVVGRVDGLAPGVYRYQPADHALEQTIQGDRREALAEAALGQDWAARAPVLLVVAAAHERTARKYGARADRYVAIEAGAAAQNVALQAVALGLGSVVVGAFDDAEVARLAGLAAGERPLAILPVGRD